MIGSMVPLEGIEPSQTGVEAQRPDPQAEAIELGEGIEPSSLPYQGSVLPVNYSSKCGVPGGNRTLHF
jgi:hypothetical protein